jgi:hypothetical protein
MKGGIMQILDRLKMELSNQEYFSDEQYIQFLLENELSATAEYNKETDQRQMLLSALDILEAVSNDIDIMRQTITEFTTTSQAYKYLEKRIQNLRDKIASIPEPEEEYSCFSLMFTSRNPANYSPTEYGSRRISKSDIDVMMGGE